MLTRPARWRGRRQVPRRRGSCARRCGLWSSTARRRGGSILAAMDLRPSASMLLAPGAASNAVSAPSRPLAARLPRSTTTSSGGLPPRDRRRRSVRASPPTEHRDRALRHPRASPGPGSRPKARSTCSRARGVLNHAPDVRISRGRRATRRPAAGRWEIIFEVVDAESRAHVTGKTRAHRPSPACAAPSRRREGRLCPTSWSRRRRRRRLADDAVISDPVLLSSPVPRAPPRRGSWRRCRRTLLASR